MKMCCATNHTTKCGMAYYQDSTGFARGEDRVIVNLELGADILDKVRIVEIRSCDDGMEERAVFDRRRAGMSMNRVRRELLHLRNYICDLETVLDTGLDERSDGDSDPGDILDKMSGALEEIRNYRWIRSTQRRKEEEDGETLF